MASVSTVGDSFGPYEIIGTLARSEIAEVLLARAGDRHVVIKRLRAELVADRPVCETFASEARLAATLEHPHVVRTIEVSEQDGGPYIAMEYVQGEDLRRLLARVHERGEQVPIAHVGAIGVAVAAALHAAHEQRGEGGELVHRGLSPANIAIDRTGVVRVYDFGIGRAATRLAASQIQALRAKAPYMSPEQCNGKKLDRRSDVFSLGVVLYELATCRRLFKASSELLTMTTIVAGQVPSPAAVRSAIPAALDAVILKALARDPADRYATARELGDALAAAVPTCSTPAELGAYVHALVGDWTEPWVSGSMPLSVYSVDFDGKGTGLAVPPPEALQAKPVPAAFKTKPSPLDLARTAAVAAAATPVVIPGGAPRKDPTVQPAARARPVARAPVPPPRRERPKTIQIPSGSARGDATLMGIGIIRPPAVVGDVTITGTGVASSSPPAAPAIDASLSGVGIPATSGFEPGGNTTEIVTALASETTVDAATPLGRSTEAADGESTTVAPAKSAAADAEPTTLAAARGEVADSEPTTLAAARGEVADSEPTTLAAHGEAADSESTTLAPRSTAAPTRGAKLSVTAFAARQREVSAVSPVVVPPPTTRLSAPIPIKPAPILDDNWDSLAFPAPPSATTFVPMGAGDAAHIGPPPAIGDDAGDSSVLSASFVGAVEETDGPARSAADWSAGMQDDELSLPPPRRRWVPFAVIGGAVLMLIVVVAVAASGGKGKQAETSANAARPEPAAKVDAPVAKPAEPAAKVDAPVAKPAVEIATAPEPATDRAAPAAKPAVEIATAPEPAAKTATPIARPTTKIATTAKSGAKGGAPTAKSTAKLATTAKPAAKGGAPTGKPAAKGAAPSGKPAAKIAPTAKSAAKGGAPTGKPAAKGAAPSGKPTAKIATTAKSATKAKPAPKAASKPKVVASPAKPKAATKKPVPKSVKPAPKR